MNTKRKDVRVLQCTECPDVFMMAGSVPIGLAFPCEVSTCLSCVEAQRHPHPMRGTCPAHPRKLVNYDVVQ